VFLAILALSSGYFPKQHLSFGLIIGHGNNIVVTQSLCLYILSIIKDNESLMLQTWCFCGGLAVLKFNVGSR